VYDKTDTDLKCLLYIFKMSQVLKIVFERLANLHRNQYPD